MAKKSVTEVLLPTSPKVNEFFFGDCWIFSKGAHFAEAMHPFMVFPPAHDPKTVSMKAITKKTFSIPDRVVDPIAFMIDVLDIDPLLIVARKADLDLRGLHRHGHVWFDYKTRKGTVKVMYNPHGHVGSVCPSDEPLFVLRDGAKGSLPKDWSYPSSGVIDLLDVSEVEGGAYTTAGWEPKDWTISTMARCADVDWDRTTTLPSFYDDGLCMASRGDMNYPKILEGHDDIIKKWVLCPGWYVYDGLLHSILPSLRTLLLGNDIKKIDAYLTEQLGKLQSTFFHDKVDPTLFVTSTFIEYHTNYAPRAEAK